jgi:hypothetical protein
MLLVVASFEPFKCVVRGVGISQLLMLRILVFWEVTLCSG